MKKLTLFNKIFLLGLIALVLTSCYVNPVTGRREIILVSESQELAMGAEYDPQLVASYGMYNDSKIQKFVEEKGAALGKLSDKPDMEFHFRVLDSPVVNAFAVPGGYIYLTRGILAQLNNEAELMGVIGHEMGHVCARHSASQQTKSMLGQLLLIGGATVSNRFAQLIDYASAGLELLNLSYSRSDEREADELGVKYSTKLGYDANCMADFFNVLERLSDNSGSSIPTFLSTHPNPTDRNGAVRQSAAKWQAAVGKQSYAVNGSSYLKLIDGIIYGDNPKNGYVENNVFYHPDMTFKFNVPAQWKLSNEATQVTMSPSDGSAILVLMGSGESSLQAAVEAHVNGLGLSNVSASSTTINGNQAIVTVADQVTNNSGTSTTNKMLSCYIQFNNQIFVFHGLTSSANFNTLRPTFEATMKSFSKLTDSSKINVKPYKISIKTVATSGTLKNILTSYGVSSSMLEEVAVLNERELSDVIAKGTMIKIVTK